MQPKGYSIETTAKNVTTDMQPKGYSIETSAKNVTILLEVAKL